MREIMQIVSDWTIPLIAVLLLGYGMIKRVKVYESFIEGAKEGFEVALRIIPYLVAILVAVGMFRASGALELLTKALSPITEPFGFPAEAIPMALIRPLSGSGAFGIMTETIKAHGPDSYIGLLVSTIQGSTETTFYVLAVYFGAVSISKSRYAIPAALSADVVGIIASVFICRIMFT
ncbi:MAG: spore maturation protein [Myxococcota bacterium]